MKHYDEKTLDLYVLGCSQIEGEKGEIERHLSQCFSCKEIVEELRRGYAVFLSPRLIGQGDETDSGITVLPRYPGVFRPDRRVFQTLRRSIWRHPVASALSGGTMMILLVLAYIAANPPKDLQPKDYQYDPQHNILKIRNANGATLWTLRSPQVAETQGYDALYGGTSVLLSDLDQNGENEIITVLEPDSLGKRRAVSCFSRSGVLRWKITLEHEVTFNGRYYPKDEQVCDLKDFLNPSTGKREILASISHSHSPSAIVRINSLGKVEGELWHFGHMTRIQKLQTSGLGAQKYLVSGCNDDRELPSFALLEPEKIVGRQENPLTPGFGYQPSEAVLQYVMAPRTLFEYNVLSRGGHFKGAEFQNEKEFGMAYYLDTLYLLDFVVDSTLRMKEVMPTDEGLDVYNQLKRQGELRQKLDQAYLHSLATGMIYWKRGQGFLP